MERCQNRVWAEWEKGGISGLFGAIFGPAWEFNEFFERAMAAERMGHGCVVRDLDLLPAIWREGFVTPAFTWRYGRFVTKLVCYGVGI